MQSQNVADGPNIRKNSLIMPNESPYTKMQLNQRLSTHGPGNNIAGAQNEPHQKTNNIDTQNSIVNNGSISINNNPNNSN